MLTIVIRSILIYLIVLIIFRLMGKRQLGQMQPFELVLTLIIADLATIPMAEVSVPVLHGILPLLTLVVLHFILALISRNSLKFSKMISGKPVIIINPKGIDYKALKKLNLSTDDLFAALRECGYFNISQVQYAIMETNGTINIFQKPEKKGEDFSCPLIINGEFLQNYMQFSGMTEQEIEKYLRREKHTLEDVLFAYRDSNGKFQSIYKRK